MTKSNGQNALLTTSGLPSVLLRGAATAAGRANLSRLHTTLFLLLTLPYSSIVAGAFRPQGERRSPRRSQICFEPLSPPFPFDTVSSCAD